MCNYVSMFLHSYYFYLLLISSFFSLRLMMEGRRGIGKEGVCFIFNIYLFIFCFFLSCLCQYTKWFKTFFPRNIFTQLPNNYRFRVNYIFSHPSSSFLILSPTFTHFTPSSHIICISCFLPTPCPFPPLPPALGLLLTVALKLPSHNIDFFFLAWVVVCARWGRVRKFRVCWNCYWCY